MITFHRIETKHPGYPFVEQLLHEAFPPEERRDDDAQRRNTDHHPLFGCYLITDEYEHESTRIGLITVWQLDGFRYIEHLATSPGIRNKGYGREIMKQLDALFPGTTVLEVEPPTDETSTRRIGFYRRCGFNLCTKEYLQPPYRKADKTFPLYLMFKGTESIDSAFEHIRNEIHREVYGLRI